MTKKKMKLDFLVNNVQSTIFVQSTSNLDIGQVQISWESDQRWPIGGHFGFWPECVSFSRKHSTIYYFCPINFKLRYGVYDH